MKKIINQKRYDTDKASMIGRYTNDKPGGGRIVEILYQKRTGEFFLYGEGGARTQYAKEEGSAAWTGGKRLMPLEYEQAQQWAKQHLTGPEYDAVFGAVKGGPKKVLSLSVGKAATEKLKRAAGKTGRTQSELVESLITKYL